MRYIIDTEQKQIHVEVDGKTEAFDLYSPESFTALSRLWLAVGWVQKYSYQFSWLGRPIIQLPEDLIRLQEIIYQVKPDVIVETGVAHGGGQIFLASLCKIMGKGRVIGVDIEIRPHNRVALEAHRLSPLITLIEGSSTDPAVVAKVKSEITPAANVLILLDANHTKDHVLRELEAYGPLLGVGSHIIVADGIMEDLAGAPRTEAQWAWDNPKRAVAEFVARRPEFQPVPPPRPFNEKHGQPACHLLAGRLSEADAMNGSAPDVLDAELMQRAHDHLALAVVAHAAASLPDVGRRWATYAEWTREQVTRFANPVEVMRFAQDPQGHGGFEVRFPREQLSAFATAEELKLSVSFPRFASSFDQWSESPFADPATTVEYNGRLVSSPVYWNMGICLTCLDHLPSMPAVVCEIGGGYGCLTRLWWSNPVHQPVKHIIVDLPESLFFSEIYLSKHFGADQIFYITTRSAPTTEMIRKTPIVLCPVAYVDMLAPVSIDLAINTYSMQEMPERYIDFYMNWLDQQDCQFFFSTNYALQNLQVMHESMNTWSPRLSPGWKTLFLAHGGPDPEMGRPAQTALYEKSPGDIQERQEAATARFSQKISMPLDTHGLAELLDLVRITMDDTAILHLLRKIVSEYPFIPKEAWYLSTWLVERGDRTFLAAHREEIETLKHRVDALRVGVKEGILSPHLEHRGTQLETG